MSHSRPQQVLASFGRLGTESHRLTHSCFKGRSDFTQTGAGQRGNDRFLGHVESTVGSRRLRHKIKSFCTHHGQIEEVNKQQTPKSSGMLWPARGMLVKVRADSVLGPSGAISHQSAHTFCHP